MDIKLGQKSRVIFAKKRKTETTFFSAKLGQCFQFDLCWKLFRVEKGRPTFFMRRMCQQQQQLIKEKKVIRVTKNTLVNGTYYFKHF